jgi:hypothetical protein
MEKYLIGTSLPVLKNNKKLKKEKSKENNIINNNINNNYINNDNQQKLYKDNIKQKLSNSKLKISSNSDNKIKNNNNKVNNIYNNNNTFNKYKAAIMALKDY